MMDDSKQNNHYLPLRVVHYLKSYGLFELLLLVIVSASSVGSHLLPQSSSRVVESKRSAVVEKAIHKPWPSPTLMTVNNKSFTKSHQPLSKSSDTRTRMIGAMSCSFYN